MFPKFKLINDPVHGYIELPEYCLDIIDTPQFQRLRDLKQLGTSYFVFPGASHHRFEHSIGVSHLARKTMKRFQKRQPELQVEARDIQMVTIAGLCHDIGHGPFSHAFEEWANKVSIRSRGETWHHEEMSKKMFEFLVDDNQLEYDRKDIRLITDLIGGHSSAPEIDFLDEKKSEKRWIFEIVANARNSIDVDKFDYIARDCLNLGVKSSYDHRRLIKYSKVIDGEICFSAKEAYNVYELFHTRYNLFKQVYSHRVSKAVEYMIQDAFSYADANLNISERIHDPREFYLLTDSIVKEIETSRSNQENMIKARNLIKRLRKRDLYGLAFEILVPHERKERFNDFCEESIVSRRRIDDEFSVDDIIIHRLILNYALQDRNPVDNVKFYKDGEDSRSFSIESSKVSLLIPKQFSESIIRIYCRDKSKIPAIRTACRAFIKQNQLESSDEKKAHPTDSSFEGDSLYDTSFTVP